MNDPNRLEGRVALVTGGSTGLGFAAAKALAARGARIRRSPGSPATADTFSG